MNISSRNQRRGKPFFLTTHTRPNNFGQILEAGDLRIGQFVYLHKLREVSVILILRMGKFKIDYVTWQVDQIVGSEVSMALLGELGLEPFSDGIWGTSYLQESAWPDMSEENVAFILSNIENRLQTYME